MGRMVKLVSSCSSSTINVSSNVAKATSSVSSFNSTGTIRCSWQSFSGSRPASFGSVSAGGHVEQRQHQIVGIHLGDVLVLDQPRS